MIHTMTVRHNFETAHRLPFLGGKCTNVHGHSWDVEVAVSANNLHDGILVEYGTFKKALRNWIDSRLDHGAALGAGDPLLAAFAADGTKVLVFGHDTLVDDLPWPTVENMAVLMGRVAALALAASLSGPWTGSTGARPTVAWARVRETAVNTAEWRP